MPRRRRNPLEDVDVEEWLRSLPQWKREALRRLARGEKLYTMDIVRMAGTPYSTVIKWLQRLEARGILKSRRVGFQNKKTWTMNEQYRKHILEALEKRERSQEDRKA